MCRLALMRLSRPPLNNLAVKTAPAYDSAEWCWESLWSLGFAASRACVLSCAFTGDLFSIGGASVGARYAIAEVG